MTISSRTSNAKVHPHAGHLHVPAISHSTTGTSHTMTWTNEALMQIHRQRSFITPHHQQMNLAWTQRRRSGVTYGNIRKQGTNSTRWQQKQPRRMKKSRKSSREH